jgi:2-oxoglutarate ferredoxin oxidoreductase subunit beta
MARAPRENRLGLTIVDYKGSETTLCAGCGHNSITNQIIKAAHGSGIQPWRVAKMSGIGCSSKTPAYFLGKSHGFNAVHGRMPSVATGAAVANRDLIVLGVSGDGDTASIGLGQFVHGVRRNAPFVYIVENNGVYGLTKGQFSATTEEGATTKKGLANELPPIDLCALAIQMGCGFVARSFSGSAKQLTALLQAALSFDGTSLVDVISPCVTFFNNEGSTRSYPYLKEHESELHTVDYIPHFSPIEEVDIEEGQSRDITLHDGSTMRLRGLGHDYDPRNRQAALDTLYKAELQREHLTGLLYFNPDRPDLHAQSNLAETPLAQLPADALRPGREALTKVLAKYS